MLGRSGSPFLTYYDEATGERAELSYATFENWVAKTANLLDDLGLIRGESVTLLLPDHWLKVVVAFATFRAGGVVGPGGPIVFAAEDRLPVESAGAVEVVGLSLRPFNPPLSRVWPGVTDYADVSAYPDQFPGAAIVAASDTMGLGPDDRALVLPGGPLLATALAAYQVGAGVVVCATAPGDVDRLVATERVTRVVDAGP